MTTKPDVSTTEIFPLLIEHIKTSKDDFASIRESLARIETTAVHTNEKIKTIIIEENKIEERVNKLETSRDMMAGVISLLGFLGLTGLIEYFKHFK